MSSADGLVDGDYYWMTVYVVRQIGMWNARLGGFELCGTDGVIGLYDFDDLNIKPVEKER